MPEHDPFESWLSNQLQDQQEYIADDGFTDMVMSALPEEPVKNPYHGIIITVATLFACLIAAWKVPVLGLLYDMMASTNLVTIYAAGLVTLCASFAVLYYSMREHFI